MAIDDGPVVIGGGPSGLAAASELRSLGIGPVTVIEREREAGGIPRHSDHTGFGLRDLRKVLSGPRYAERYRELADELAVEVLTETMVTSWEGERGLKLTGPKGRWELEPPAVVLATGCRERPRSARLVPGSRPTGVMTTSTLQQLVHLRGQRVGRRAVIVGAEHVSFSAVATLAHAGASVAGLVTELPKHQSLGAFRAGAAVRYRAPVWSRTRLSAIHGAERVESVELTELESGSRRNVECDLVIFTADWIPDHELAVMAGCDLDSGSLGPLVDQALRTTTPGVFAAGNLLHPAETADICALDGRHVAARWLPISEVPGSGRPALGWSLAIRSRGSLPACWCPQGTVRRATVSSSARRSSCAGRGSGSARTDASSGEAGSAVWSPVGRRTFPRPGPVSSIRSWRPRDRRSRVARIALAE